MAALRKEEVRSAPVQKVSAAGFARFAETCKNPPRPSSNLKATVGRFTTRKG